MKKFLFALLLLLSLPKIIYAETITFKTVKLHSKHPKVTGSLPIIQGKGFEKVNQNIKKDILKTFDQPNWYVEMTPQKIYQNTEYLSFEMYYQVSDMTSRYKSFYFTVDLKSKQIMRLNTLLEKYHVTQAEINQQLKSYVLPCLDKK